NLRHQLRSRRRRLLKESDVPKRNNAWTTGWTTAWAQRHRLAAAGPTPWASGRRRTGGRTTSRRSRLVKITRIETIQLPEHSHLIWVQIHTDEGVVGTGETTPRVSPVRRVIHDTLADILLGRNPL